MTPRRAVISFRGAEADIVMKALSPEAGRGIPRVDVSITGAQGEATLTIEATDVAALRAALNSYLRWADVAMNVAKEVRK